MLTQQDKQYRIEILLMDLQNAKQEGHDEIFYQTLEEVWWYTRHDTHYNASLRWTATDTQSN